MTVWGVGVVVVVGGGGLNSGRSRGSDVNKVQC